MDNWVALLLVGVGVAVGVAVAMKYGSPQTVVEQKGEEKPPQSYREVRENEEAWEVERDDRGRLLGVTVHRSVKENG